MAAGLAAAAMCSVFVATGEASAAVAPGGLQTISANTIVSGTVVNGSTPVAGASITPVVFPNPDVMAALASGATVPSMELPAVTSAANGNFKVDLDPSTLASKYLDSKGRPTIELRINTNTQGMTWMFTADTTAAGWTSTKAETDAADGETPDNETLVVNFASSKVTEVEGSDATSYSQGKTSTSAAESAGAAAGNQSAVQVGAVAARCASRAEGLYTNRVEPFAHVYPGKTAAATITQVYGTDHTLGIAVSVMGGAWAGASAGGSKTISLSASGSKRLLANSTVFNSINFRQYYEACDTGYYKYWRQAESVYAILSRIDAAAEPNFVYCAYYGPGYTLKKYKGTNVTYRSEVSVGPVSVNAQSGWNTSTEISWATGGTRNGICGSTSVGWVTAPEAEANSA